MSGMRDWGSLVVVNNSALSTLVTSKNLPTDGTELKVSAKLNRDQPYQSKSSRRLIGFCGTNVELGIGSSIVESSTLGKMRLGSWKFRRRVQVAGGNLTSARAVILQ